MNIGLRTLAVVIAVAVVRVPASAHVGSGVLNRLEVQQLAAADTAEAHSALAKHFMALADAYTRAAARDTAFATRYMGNPNHTTGIDIATSRLRKAEDANTEASTARAMAAYHLILSIGGTSRRPAGAPAFDGGKGAPLPTRLELDVLAVAARTPSGHREVAEYLLILARSETANAEAYTRTARTMRVSGARNTERVAARYEHLARLAREAARHANLAAELHRQLAPIG